MAKRLDITSDMEAKIAKAVGVDKIDTTHFAAFEAIFLNTEPLSKPGSIFDKAIVTRATLNEMADLVDRGESVPLQILHLPGLPIGKIFNAQVVLSDKTGKPELRGQFYMDTRTHNDLVLGVDNGTIDEVSVGVRPKALNCSECGFDYMAPGHDANFWTRTCPDGHVLHQDGVHAKFNGVDRWLETSLVSKGAAKEPKIVGRAKALLGDEEFQRLAASGVNPEATVFFGTSVPSTPKDSPIMDLKELEATITAKVKAETALEAATAGRTAAEARVAELTAKLAQLETERGTNVAEVQAKLDAAMPAVEFIKESAKAALVATGKAETDLPAELSAQITLIKSTANALHQIPNGGTVKPAGAGDEKPKADFSAFKTR